MRRSGNLPAQLIDWSGIPSSWHAGTHAALSHLKATKTPCFVIVPGYRGGNWVTIGLAYDLPRARRM